MKKTVTKILSVIIVIALSLCVFLSCESAPDDPSPSDDKQSDATTDGTTADKTDSEKTDVPDGLTENADSLVVSCAEGTSDCFTKENGTLTFSSVSADTVYSLSGEFNGQIVIDCGDDYKFELELCGLTLYSGEQSPITVISGDKVTIVAKKGTQNYVYDTREAVSDDDETAKKAAIYSVCDLNLEGKGELVVISENNNGIHTKDDLKIKNLTLAVTCSDNALKGNDGVTISSGTITLVSKYGDGIKTTNSDVSSKGNQKGSVVLSGGTIDIYAACDGIDAAYDVEIDGETVLNVYTDRYSPYSENASNSSVSVKSARPNMPGRPGGGFGGMTDGNTEKSETSAKGIKSDNEIIVSNGTISINSYDDSLHANGEVSLENGSVSSGNVNVYGGTLTLFSKDDAIHADGTLTVFNGKITVTGSYEGLEGALVIVKDGDISIVSSDDGINATATSGTGITFDGGNVYVYAGGDGIDSNSRTSYQGVLFAGGNVIIVSTSGGDSSIDTENGYAYSGGTVLAVCPSNGMTNETLNCRNFSSVGTKTTKSLSLGQTLAVKVDGEQTVSLTMPCALNAFVVYLGSTNASFSVD